MNEFHSRGKEILKIFINNGYEAYFVGEAVRNIILSKSLQTIEITTSAHLEIVKQLFQDCIINDINENLISVKYAGYTYYIKSFASSGSKVNNSILTKHYSKNLLDDLASRDYSINAIAMSHSGKLTDAYEGYSDINKRLIAHIGNSKERFFKDPSLIIKGFALMSELNYKFVSKTKKAIIRRKKYLTHSDIDLLLDDLKKMFEGVYVKRALYTMCKYNVHKTIPVFNKVLRKLQSNYKKQTFEEILLMADVLNGKLNDKFRRFISDYDEYCKVYDIVLENKNFRYDQVTLYTKGLKSCVAANKINYYLGRSKLKVKAINKKWDKLIVKSPEELNYRVENLMKIIREKDHDKIKFVQDELVKLVLVGEIKNTRTDLEKTVIQILQKNNIYYNLQGVFNSNNEKELENNNSDISYDDSNEIKVVVNDIIKMLEENKNINSFSKEFEKDLYSLIKKYTKKGDS